MNLTVDVLEVLSRATCNNSVVFLPPGQLDRALYVKVNKALEALGGSWNRKLKGHVFSMDPETELDRAILMGHVSTKEDIQFFETSDVIVQKMLRISQIEPGMSVLEPSAGRGAICRHIPTNANLTIIERDLTNWSHLCLWVESRSTANLIPPMDFLDYTPAEKFDRVIMNPPFTKQQDIDHILHAFSMLKSGGRLVSVASAGVRFRNNKKTVQFREIVESHGSMSDLPEGSFLSSGTGVRTVLVTLNI